MRVTRSTVAAAAVALLASVVAGCGSSSSNNSSSTAASAKTTAANTAAASSTTAASASDIAAAQKLVEGGSAMTTSFTPPGPPIKNAKSLVQGKTVWYIPVTALPPWFQIQSKVQQSVWSKLGAKVHVCDGKANPTSISACLQQAVANKAALVVTDSIPVPFAQAAYQKVVDSKIPVVAGYTDKSASPTQGSFGKYFRGISGEEAPTQELGAAYAIVSSGGKGKVLVAGANDIPSSVAASQAAIAYFKNNCPGCEVKSFMLKTVGNQNLASEVSGQILKDPNVNVFYTPYEAPSGALFLQGIRNSGKKMTFMSTAGDVAGLTRIKQGTQLGDVGLDPVYQGWNYADAGLRALAGMPPAQYKGIVHLFTKDNVPSNPTIAGWLSGMWYSNLGFQPLYLKNWNAS
jgi:ribose transport system substrate-binding protein